MNWHNVNIMVSIYTILVVMLSLLALGKFFCVKVLYDLYDRINNYIDETLPGIFCIGLVIEIATLVCYHYEWKPGLMLLLFAISIITLIGIVFLVLGLFFITSKFLSDYHRKLKERKNIY